MRCSYARCMFHYSTSNTLPGGGGGLSCIIVYRHCLTLLSPCDVLLLMNWLISWGRPSIHQGGSHVLLVGCVSLPPTQGDGGWA